MDFDQVGDEMGSERNSETQARRLASLYPTAEWDALIERAESGLMPWDYAHRILHHAAGASNLVGSTS